MSAPLRIANCSGFYGDRLSAMRELLDGGPVDVLTGDYLAELTMLILGRQKLQDPTAGYARSFVKQLEQCLATALERGVRIVSNAGGLNPSGLAAAIGALAGRLGLDVKVATVSGDDLMGRLDELDVRLGERAPGDRRLSGGLTANAYLGCFGIVRALEAGADVVVTGRVTDASLVVGPAAWHHGWQRNDLDALAGATVAGHLLECGAQATGGNFSGFADLLETDPGALDAVGFPIAELAADGSCVLTKHPATGGAVTIATVTEQLLYECTGSRYGGPDVISRFDTVRLEQQAPDRVAVSGARGLPPSGWLKVAANRLGGYRSSVTIPLTGLDVVAKAAVLQRQLAPMLATVAESSVVLARTDAPDAGSQERASAMLHVSVKDPDRERVGRAFTAPLIELALASIPGFCTAGAPPSPSAYGVYEPGWVRADEVPEVVTLPDGSVETLPLTPHFDELPPDVAAGSGEPPVDAEQSGLGIGSGSLAAAEPTRRVPLGVLLGARSGDKGGAATLGVYTVTDEAFSWLEAFLTCQQLQELLPEAASLPVTREVLGNVRSLLFQLPGLLGEGVAASIRFDPQAKALGEWLRSRTVDVPVRLLDPPGTT